MLRPPPLLKPLAGLALVLACATEPTLAFPEAAAAGEQQLSLSPARPSLHRADEPSCSSLCLPCQPGRAPSHSRLGPRRENYTMHPPETMAFLVKFNHYVPMYFWFGAQFHSTLSSAASPADHGLLIEPFAR
jgi:hypothetical protein